MSKEAKKKALDAFSEARDARRPREEVWEEIYKIYRAYTKEKEEGKSNLFIPYLFSVVETVVPRLTDTIFSQKPYIKPLPRESGDMYAAEALEILMSYQLDKIKFKSKATDWFKQATMYGSGFVKVVWKTETKKIKEKVPINFNNPMDIWKVLLADIQNPESMGTTIEIEKEATTYDGPDIELLDISDVYPDPYGSAVQKCRYIVHKSLKPLKYIEDMIKQGIYKGNLKEIKKTSLSKEDDQFSSMSREVEIGLKTEPSSDKGMYEILEYLEEDRVITLVNRQIVVRDTENPYNHKQIPIVDIKNTIVPLEFWGIGEIEPNKRLQHELNTTRNQRIDIVSGSINNMWAYLESAIDPDDLVFQPNGLIRIKNIGKSIGEVLQQLGPQRVSPAAITEEQTIKKDMQEVSGVTQYVKGLAPDTQATATEITSLQNEANYRFKQKIMNKVEGLERIGELMVALNQQFMDADQFVRIAGERAAKLQYLKADGTGHVGPDSPENSFSFIQIRPEDIMGQFDIKVASTALEPLADRQVKRQQLLEVFQVLAQQGLPSMELTKEILKTYDMPATDNVIAELENLQKQQQQMQMLEAMPPGQQTPASNQVPNPGGMI